VLKNNEDPNVLMKKIIRETQQFVRILFFTILRFYDIKLNERDLKKDLLINMTTTFVMKKNTYSIIMNTILLANNERVKKIQKHLNKYKYKVNLEKLGVRKYFWFNKGFRDLLRLNQNQSIIET
jgi:hypothetical protein